MALCTFSPISSMVRLAGCFSSEELLAIVAPAVAKTRLTLRSFAEMSVTLSFVFCLLLDWGKWPMLEKDRDLFNVIFAVGGFQHCLWAEQIKMAITEEAISDRRGKDYRDNVANDKWRNKS
jgi:hypothetical protein